MTTNDIKDAIVEADQRIDAIGGEDKADLESRINDLRADARALREEAARKDDRADELEQKIEDGEHEITPEEEEEIRALKAEKKRLRRVLKRHQDGEKITA